jgi:hypothetical protein
MNSVRFLLPMILGLVGCASSQDKAMQFGAQGLGLTGVSVKPLCESNEMPYQIHGQKYAAQMNAAHIPVSLGYAQVVCCSSDACRLAGESNLFPRPEWIGAATSMIDSWKGSFSTPVSVPSPLPPRQFPAYEDRIVIPVVH